MSFETEISRNGDTLRGPLRAPVQMLAEQEYAGHTSVHDDETAAKLGLAGAPIEGPTHFSQIDPLAVERWGRAWFERGCVSAHFLNMVVEGEQVGASLEPVTATLARVDAQKSDGTPVLTGTASIGHDDETDSAPAQPLDPMVRDCAGQPGVGQAALQGSVPGRPADGRGGSRKAEPTRDVRQVRQDPSSQVRPLGDGSDDHEAHPDTEDEAKDQPEHDQAHRHTLRRGTPRTSRPATASSARSSSASRRSRRSV